MAFVRKTSSRDLPLIGLFFSAILGFSAIGLRWSSNHEVPKRSGLYPESGTVRSISRTNYPKAGPKLEISLIDGSQFHYWTQDDLSCDAPKLQTLRVGDHLNALVKLDYLGRGTDSPWEIRRDGITVVSYEQTERHFRAIQEQEDGLWPWMGGLAVLAFVVAIWLRLSYGAWQDRTETNASPTIAGG